MCRFTIVTPDIVVEPRGTLNNEQVELQDNIDFLEREVNDSFEQLTLAIEKRRKELLKQIHETKKEKLQNLNQYPSKSIYGSRKISNDLHVGNCLRFVRDDKLLDTIKDYGILDEGRASAENSTATGSALKYGIANEQNKFQLTTYDNSQEVSWVEQDRVESFLQLEDQTYYCNVEDNCNGVYNITYEVPHGGEYELHVQVNGRCINNSHFKCIVFEKQHVAFHNQAQPSELKFQTDNSVLIEKTEVCRTTKLYTNMTSPVRAWKARVTTACPKIALRLGYSNAMTTIPDLTEEFYCKFHLTELLPGLSHPNCHHHHHRHHEQYIQTERHHGHHTKHRGSKRGLERKQSMYKRESITFIVFQDTANAKIYVVGEDIEIEKQADYANDINGLKPYIGIKHFCTNSVCPRPVLTIL